MKRRKLRRRIGALVLTLALAVTAVPVSAEELEEENGVQGTGQETDEPALYVDDSGMIQPEPGSTTEMVLDQDYQLQNPGVKRNSYKFVFQPTESAGYYLDFYGELWSYEMQITCQVLDNEENLLAGSRGYYMLEAGKSYTFQVENYTTLTAERSAGRLTMEKYCDWDECLEIDERGFVTGMAEAFEIVCIPEGVKGMDELYYFYQNIGTLILPESIQDPVDTSVFWRANYRYETPKTGGRYLAVDGVLYDQIDRIMVNIPLFREGSYTVREGTKIIASRAFFATRLTEVIFPDSVTQFDEDVFATSNEYVRKIMLPAEAEGLDVSQFYSLYALEELVVPDNSENYRTIDGVLFKKSYDDTWELVFYPIGKSDISYTVPDDVSVLGSGSFAREKKGGMESDPVRNLKFLTIPASVKTLDWCLSTGGSNSSYTEMTLRGYEGSAAHEYWKKNFSNSDLIKWETIGEAGGEDSKEFTLGRDNNNFFHWGWDSEGGGFYGCDRYWLDEEDYDRLFSHEMSEGKKNELREKIFEIQGKDAGHCFGSSSVISMVYNGVLDMEDITDSGAPWIYGLQKPCEDPKYLSTIDYYHLMQYLYSPQENNIAYIHNKFHNEDEWTNIFYPEWIQWIFALKGDISSKEDISNFFNTARRELDDGGCLMLNIPSHSVVMTGYEKTDTGYTFQIYDLNSVMRDNIEGEFYYLETNEDMTEFSCEELNLRQNDYLELCLQEPAQIDPMLGGDGQTDVDGNTGITKIILDLWTEFTITDENGDRISSEAESAEDITMDVTDVQLISSDSENPTSSEGSLSVKGGEQYTLSDLGMETDITIYNDNGYLSLSGSNIESAEMIPGEGIEIKGKDNCSFTVVIDTDQVLETKETGLVEVSGTTDGGTIRIETKVNSETETDEVIVNVSDQTLQNLTANSYTKNGIIPLDIKDSLIEKESISFYAEELPDTGSDDPDPEYPDGDEGKQPPVSENEGDGTTAGQNDTDDLKKDNGEDESSDRMQAVQTGEEKWTGYVVTFLGAAVVICCIAYLRYRRKKDV